LEYSGFAPVLLAVVLVQFHYIMKRYPAYTGNGVLDAPFIAFPFHFRPMSRPFWCDLSFYMPPDVWYGVTGSLSRANPGSDGRVSGNFHCAEREMRHPTSEFVSLRDPVREL